ncbi:hypothetical protein LOAG_11976 [Loa loa]|uniref:Uncharacterized protein n=1 Tax=Loa loa TaxID=7209 RepID=A0A1S0TN89_LOALO|nr:hypothetical protein LOAG_11976 [Loa loa]EFO16532.1 hypothetical protein LOAG_11976 [Loa loa]
MTNELADILFIQELSFADNIIRYQFPPSNFNPFNRAIRKMMVIVCVTKDAETTFFVCRKIIVHAAGLCYSLPIERTEDVGISFLSDRNEFYQLKSATFPQTITAYTAMADCCAAQFFNT